MDCIVDVQQSIDNRLIALDNLEMVRRRCQCSNPSGELKQYDVQLVESIDNANGAPYSIHLNLKTRLTWEVPL